MVYRGLHDFKTVIELDSVINADSMVVPVNKESENAFFTDTPKILLLMHADPTSWISIVPSFAKYASEYLHPQGRNLIPFIFYHKTLLKLPLFKTLANYFTGNIVESYEHLLSLLKEDEPYLFATCPEGSNSMFEFHTPVGPFQQHALIKASLVSGRPIIVASVKQSKRFAIPVNLPFTHMFKKNAKGIRIPIIRKGIIKIIYEALPQIMSSDDFLALDSKSQHIIINKVAKKIRKMMLTNLKTLQD